jgi:SAM-dependent methyltransferase/uncharacterized protein YbaR (Trm112 family)
MRIELLDNLACHACASAFEVEVTLREDDEIITGTLTCRECRESHAITGGVPRMNLGMAGLERTAATFSYEWKAHHEGRLEEDTLFGLTLEQDWQYFLEATGVNEDELDGMLVLDAGCGSGRPTRQIAERGATVIGVDIMEAVDEAFAATRQLKNVHIVQANLFELPFRKGTFDLVWSNGVIHHTPNAEAAHAKLAFVVRPGGLLYVWVYAKRFNPFRFTKDVLDFLRVTRLPTPILLRIAKAFSYASLLLLSVYRTVRRLPKLRPRTRWGERTIRSRTAKELQLTWFDALSPEFDSRHSEAEVIRWFERLGFTDIAAIEEPKVGVRGTAPQSGALPETSDRIGRPEVADAASREIA